MIDWPRRDDATGPEQTERGDTAALLCVERP